jgi:hypothetical protein
VVGNGDPHEAAAQKNVEAQEDTRPRDPSIGLTAAAGIFAALIGTSVLDIGNSSPPMRAADYVVVAGWILVISLFAALSAGWGPKWLAWCAGLAVGLATAGLIVATTFGGTRDHDHVLLRVDDQTRAALASLCRRQFSAQGIPGTISTKTLSEEFVIIDFSDGEGGRCQLSISPGAPARLQRGAPRERREAESPLTVTNSLTVGVLCMCLRGAHPATGHPTCRRATTLCRVMSGAAARVASVGSYGNRGRV